MGIGNAKGKAQASTQNTTTSAAPKERSSGPLPGHQQRAATLRIYVKDKNLLAEAKQAAFEDETSLSELWEKWTLDWLNSRR